MIDSRLVIKDKGDGIVKARLSAKDLEHTKRDDLYVPTPSPAIVRTLLTRAHRRGWDTCLKDFVQAFLHAPIDGDKVTLRPPRSVRRHGWLWVLQKALYGLRVAPQKFHDWLANLFVSLGFRQMVGHPACFRHDEKEIEVVIHIDDGIIAGPPTQMTEIKQILQGGASMKDLGSIDKHGKKYLGKIIKRTAKGFTIQADPEFCGQTPRGNWLGSGSLISHTWNERDETHGRVGKGGLG